MSTFFYKARDAAGRSVKGSLEAAGEVELTEKLHKMGFVPTEVEPAPAAAPSGVFSTLFERVSADEVVLFVVQLSNLVHSGVSILMSLETLARQAPNQKLRRVIEDTVRRVEAGEYLSSAFARYPEVIPTLFVSLVKAGEASGKLDTVLSRYAVYAEAQQDFRRRVRGAIAYPAALLAGGAAVTLFIVSVIIPEFVEMFEKAGVPLPAPTRALDRIGTAIAHFWHTGLLAALLAWVAARFAAETRNGRLFFDALKLRMPGVGPVLRKAAIVRIAGTLGTLVDSGVPILDALGAARRVAGNESLAQALLHVERFVEKGERISDGLRAGSEFPADMVQMVSVGEESGTLPVMLEKIAHFYEKSVEYSLRRFTAALEPAFLLVMGGMVGFIMLSMMLPIFDMMEIIR